VFGLMLWSGRIWSLHRLPYPNERRLGCPKGVRSERMTALTQGGMIRTNQTSTSWYSSFAILIPILLYVQDRTFLRLIHTLVTEKSRC
jgi:hypothetical protein